MSFLKAAIGVLSPFIEKTDGKKPRVLVILGPTASGKTALSIELAKRFNGEVISADSRQVYRTMDIGTDKIPLEKNERGELLHQGIRHHLIDVIDPDGRFTVAEFKKESERLIGEISARGALPIIAGGTGLYIRALTENFLIPEENKVIRARLYEELARDGAEALHKKLQHVDPEGASKIHVNNHPYIVRALEIFEVTGKTKAEQKCACPFEVLKIGLVQPREVLFERINRRAHEQITKNGLIEETKSLLARGYSPTLSSMSSLGYREVIQFLNGEATLEQADELLQQNTRNYAKRQLTWFKKEPNVICISPA